MEHSILPPSNAEQWVNCAGSVQLNMLASPKPPDPSALEGIVAADVAAEMVTGYTKGQLPGRMSSALMDTVRDGVTITKEMTDAALLYAKHVGPSMQYARVFGGPNLGIERRVEIPGIHELCFGTPDFWLYNENENILQVIDFKYGHGVVEAFENWQLISYVRGICDELRISPAKTFLTIVQPRTPHRNGPIRTWTINNPLDLNPYFDSLSTAAALAIGSNPSTATGPWCRRCPSLLVCDTARNISGCALDIIGGLTTTTTNDDSLGFELELLERAEKIVKHRATALRAEVEAKIRSGTRIPNWKMEGKHSRPFWTIEHEQIVQFGQSHGIDLNVDKTMTPKQAISAGVPEALVNAFSKTEPRGVKLVHNDLKEARFVFGASKGAQK
jgi:hypothetical protein